MKRFYLFWLTICLLCSFFIIFFLFQKKTEERTSLVIPIVKEIQQASPATAKIHVTKTLFIPYWTVGSQQINTSEYNQLVYFGVSVNVHGIATQEDGYKNIDQFLTLTNRKSKRLLAIRMITTDTNRIVLADKNLQKKIIDQSIHLAKAKEFDGVVLDFEISALGFTTITNNISNFEIKFADTVKENKLLFYATMYGDTFSRFRPFNVKSIASHADGVMIMAYDFHKANGNAGPNFPLKDNQNEGYDFEKMIHDFLQQVPPEKITIVFGLYGYDWTVDEKGNSVDQATSLSDNQIQQKFLNKCAFTNCNVIIDGESAETKILYTDSNQKNHILWFEDVRSIAKKTAFLASKNIKSIAYWAYSYF